MPVSRVDSLSNFILGKPLEVVQAILVFRQVRLPAHDAGLHEEDLLAELFGAFFWVGDRFGVCDDLVANRHMPDDPGVHVRAGGVEYDAFGCL